MLLVFLGVMWSFSRYYPPAPQQFPHLPPSHRPHATPVPDMPVSPVPSTRNATRPPPRRVFEDVIVESEGDTKGSATGTAFALDDRGIWMTARHVVSECRELYLLKDSARLDSRISSREVIKVSQAFEDALADIAVITTGVKADPLPVAAAEPVEDEILFHYGFPQSKQGALRTRMLGRSYVRDRVRKFRREPVYVLSQESAFPKSLLRVNGISGGPVLNDSGEVVGVSIAGSERRGRVYASTVETIARVANERQIRGLHSSKKMPPLSSEAAFEKYGRQLEKQRRMLMVLCLNG